METKIKNTGLDRETMVVCLFAALTQAIGVYFILVLLLGVSVSELDTTTVLSSILALFSLIYSVLLYRNC